MEDLDAVMDAAGLTRAALLGAVEAGLCAMYAASYPERVSALVLVNVAPAGALGGAAPQFLDVIENHWGEGRMLPLLVPSRVGDRRFEEWWMRYERASASAAMTRRIIDLFVQTDLRGVLPSVRVPTLVLHSTDNRLVPVELGREVAALIPGARFVEIPGGDLYGWADPDNPGQDEIEEFLTGHRRQREPERVLATVLFTDIIASTELAARLGDQAWRELLDRHNQVVRGELERWRGKEVKTLGDGFLATFDGPARAVRCARAIIDALAASSSTATWQGSRSTSGRGSGRSPTQARCWCQARSRTWSWARSCTSPSAESTRCEVCPANGACTRWPSSFLARLRLRASRAYPAPNRPATKQS
jgi:hypothetical protein